MSNEINKDRVSFRKVDHTDIPTVEIWLNKEHIKRWYGDPQEWLNKIRNISGEYGWLNHYIVQF